MVQIYCKKQTASAMERIKKRLCCRKKRRTVNRIFGVNIETLCKREDTLVPNIIIRICDHITQSGIETEELFRVNGNSRLIHEMRTSFNEAGDAELNNIHASASLLKQFLRELPEPVVPISHQENLIETKVRHSTDDSFEIIHTLKRIIGEVPERRKETLKYLLEFMLRISGKSEFNKMTSSNLAVVFGPSLFRCDGSVEGAKNQGYLNGVLMHLLESFDDIFMMKTISEAAPETSIVADKEKKDEGSKSVAGKAEKPARIVVYFESRPRAIQKRVASQKRFAITTRINLPVRAVSRQKLSPLLVELMEQKRYLEKIMLGEEDCIGRLVYQQVQSVRRRIDVEEARLAGEKITNSAVGVELRQ